MYYKVVDYLENNVIAFDFAKTCRFYFNVIRSY